MKTKHLLLSILLSAVYYSGYTQILFEESAENNGLQFVYKESMKMGGGAASFDYDNDGDEDIYIVGGQNPDGLFENDGTGTFTEVSQLTNISWLTESLMTTSVISGDIDNDGIREIFVGTIGVAGSGLESIQSNLLLKYNATTSTYEDITVESLITDESFCMGAHFFDSNLDGYLDLYLINYVETPSVIQEGNDVIGFDHECYSNKLYINNGDGTFTDQTSFYGLDQSACSLAATSSDLDWDGDPDLIVANDFGKWLTPNQLFQNEGKDTPYSDISESSNANAQMYGMGIAVGDYDEDLDLDFYITNIGENYFFENSNNMLFDEISQDKEVQNSHTPNGLNTTGWGTILEDFDNDTYLDLFVSNGYVYSVVDIDDLDQNDELYLGNSEHTFQRMTPDCGIDFKGPSRGAMRGDWNQDGHLDLITITNELLTPDTQSSFQYYQNQANDNNWVAFNLEGTMSNKDAFGSKVIVYAEERAFLRELRSGDSHASQNSASLHFGLANIQVIDSIKVYWPSGITESFTGLEINSYHDITENLSTTINENNHLLRQVNIYPNPASNFINIEIENDDESIFNMKLIDTNGRQLLSKNIQNNFQIITSALKTGLYRIQLFSKNYKSISKNILIVNP